jgi:hypothetical protein
MIRFWRSQSAIIAREQGLTRAEYKCCVDVWVIASNLTAAILADSDSPFKAPSGIDNRVYQSLMITLLSRRFIVLRTAAPEPDQLTHILAVGPVVYAAHIASQAKHKDRLDPLTREIRRFTAKNRLQHAAITRELLLELHTNLQRQNPTTLAQAERFCAQWLSQYCR